MPSSNSSNSNSSGKTGDGEKRSYLIPGLLDAVEEIGRHGEEKYGEHSFQAMVRRGDRTRPTERHNTDALIEHAINHLTDYDFGDLHDYFHTRRHQLAAAVFNIMMEFYFAEMDLEDEDTQPAPPATGQ